MSNDHNKAVNITPKARVPLSLVWPIVCFAVLVTIEWQVTLARMDTYHSESLQMYKDSVSVRQAQEWIDDFRENNPAVKVPRLPAKSDENAARTPDINIARRD